MTAHKSQPKVGERRFMAEVWLTPPKDEDGESDMDRQKRVCRVVPTLEEARAVAKQLAARPDADHPIAGIYEVEWTNDMGDDGEYDPRFKCHWWPVSDIVEEVWAEEG